MSLPGIVMKFGGSSVANRRQIEKVLGIVRGRVERRPMVVSSAHKGITDALVAAARGAARREDTADTVIGKQTAIAEDLGCDPSLMAPFFEELR